jgi:hypothetical protein
MGGGEVFDFGVWVGVQVDGRTWVSEGSSVVVEWKSGRPP